jgi:hypothetical protein
MPGLEEQPFRVLIVGGSYSGLAATLNLIDLCHGRKCRFNLNENDKAPQKRIPVQVTIVDERDGYCMPQYSSNIWSRVTDLKCFQTI